jgi:PTH1 family peptidyl-tRNA hydrolase
VAHVVVGLGNPGLDYRDTRHNVGQRVLDHLARKRLGRTRWEPERDRALVCQATWRGEPLRLVKPWAFMNESGPAVLRALRRHHADARDLILVYDDIDLPLGTVRTRMKGSHGGHNGVRSVIDTLGTSEIRRVKVGIGRPDQKADVPDHVLTVFDAEELPIVERVVAEAADRVLLLVQSAIAR